MDDLEQWIEREAEARRQEALREERDPAYVARRALSRQADAARNARSAEAYAQWARETKARGEWVEEEDEE